MKAEPAGGYVQVCGQEGHGEGRSLEEGRGPLPLTILWSSQRREKSDGPNKEKLPKEAPWNFLIPPSRGEDSPRLDAMSQGPTPGSVSCNQVPLGSPF